MEIVLRCVLISISHWCTGLGRVVYWSQSGPKHVRHVSVEAVDPHHQGEGDGHKGPGDPLHACRQGVAFSGRIVPMFTRFQVVPGRKLKHLIQKDDRQGDLQHHHPLGYIEGGDLENDLREKTRERKGGKERV